MPREGQMHAKYQKISYVERKKLIELVLDKKFTIIKASQEIGISPSTARTILFKYKTSGAIFQPKNPKRSQPKGVARQNKKKAEKTEIVNLK